MFLLGALFGIGSCLIIALLLGLISASRRADDGEDSITRMLTENHGV